MKAVLDACCGGRMWWFDKSNPAVLGVDQRVMPLGSDKYQPGWSCQPDMTADFRDLPFEDESFYMVVFDPPHIVTTKQTGSVLTKYGILNPDTWQQDLKQGFSECWRVLKTYGTLVFKWEGSLIPVRDFFPATPIVGTRKGSMNPKWVVFLKTEEEGD